MILAAKTAATAEAPSATGPVGRLGGRLGAGASDAAAGTAIKKAVRIPSATRAAAVGSCQARVTDTDASPCRPKHDTVATVVAGPSSGQAETAAASSVSGYTAVQTTAAGIHAHPDGRTAPIRVIAAEAYGGERHVTTGRDEQTTAKPGASATARAADRYSIVNR